MNEKQELKSLSGKEWVARLIDDPSLADRCVWSKLDERHLFIVFAARPDIRIDPARLDAATSSRIAAARHLPKAARPVWRGKPGAVGKNADYAEPDDEYTFECRWADRLARFPWRAFECDWSRLSGYDQMYILQRQPCLVGFCDWSKLDGGNWADLLREQPQFAAKCAWSKLDGYAWSKLLSAQPQFADRCDWAALTDLNWATLLEKQPQFADRRAAVNVPM